MIENPELFYKMNKMSLKEHREIIAHETGEKDQVKASKDAPKVPPSYYKKIKVHKMHLFMTLKSDLLYGMAVHKFD